MKTKNKIFKFTLKGILTPILKYILVPIIVTIVALWLYDYFFNKDPGCIMGNDDCENEYGVYQYSNGNVYKGYFKKGKPDGEGILFFSNGTEIKGLFEKGKPPTNEIN